ncbi:c-type cytochrome domain-containing protein [Rosettibacter firmus]|uniref:c-type cytochrome domain-containing protein n=1 Tax=Rosettibacter firmus TaxID=3111522 RepID=UPI00336BBAFF
MNKKTVYNFLLIITFSLLLIYSCDDTITQEDLDNKIIPSSNVSYSQHIQPVFDAKCNYAGCHNDRDLAGGLSLTNYYNTTSDYLIVAPGLPDNSKLVWAIEGRGTNPMPPVGRWPLTKNQINGIRTWIKEGAKNN